MITWNNLLANLRAHSHVPPPKPADSFWHEFEIQAAEIRRESPAPCRRRTIEFRLAYAAACMVLAFGLVAAGYFFILPGPSPVIKSLNITSAHDSVFILNGTDDGVIIWLSGVPETTENGG